MVNWGLIVWVQGAICEGLGGFMILVKACNLDTLGMLALMIVLNWVVVWDYSY